MIQKGICEFCGEPFEVTRGRLGTHCKKAECVKKAHVKSQKKYYEKMKKKVTVRVVKKEEPNVVYSTVDKIDTKLQMTDFGDILQIARELGALRYNLIELMKKNNEEVSKYDKADQTFLHKLEFLENLSDQEAMDLIVNEKKNRELRRNIKNRKYLIQALLDGILIKNPNAYMVQVITGEGDICKNIRKAKLDESLYKKVDEQIGNN